MKQGFALLELLIALAIAAIVSVSLTLFLDQTRRYQASIEDRVSVYTRASVALHQFEKDVMGAHVPIQNKEYEKAQKKKTQPKTPAQTKETPKPAPQETKEKKAEPVKPVARVFYVEQSRDMLKRFTCITSNPLQVYWSKQVGRAKPKIARVVYSMVPDTQQDGSFILMRQEGDALDLKAYATKGDAKIRAYELIDGVKSCTLTFTVFHEPEQPKKGEKAPPQPQKRQVEERTSWDWPVEQKKEEKKKPEPALPNFVTINLELWDERYERTTEFTYTVPVMADTREEQKEEEKPKKETPGKGTKPASRERQK